MDTHSDTGTGAPERASVASGSKPIAPSLEDLLQAGASFDANPRLSWASSRANVPLPGSQASSISQRASPSPLHPRHVSPDSYRSRSRPRSRLADQTHYEEPRPRVRINENDNRYGASAKATIQDDEGPEPQPLWYRSQTFSHRYGSSARREPLLSPPLRAHSLPVEQSTSKSRESLFSKIYSRPLDTHPLPSLSPSTPQQEKKRFSRPARPKVGLREVLGGTSSIKKGKRGAAKRQVDRTKPDVSSPVDQDTSKNASENTAGKDALGAETPEHHSKSIPKLDRATSHPKDTHDFPPPPTISVGPNDLDKLINSSFAQSNYPPPKDVNGDSIEDPPPSRLRIEGSTTPGAREYYRPRRETPRPARSPRNHAVLPVASVGKTASRDRSTPKVEEHTPVVPDYGELVRRLATHMPHLVNVREVDTRKYRTGKIFGFDQLESGGLPRLTHFISIPDETTTSILQRRLRDLKTDRVRNVRSRYILVEDLSPQLIRNLGSTFWLNPEFFEEHLNRSGYRNKSYEEPTPRTWNTNATPKDYASVRWFRPVHRSRVKPLSDIDRERLLEQVGGTAGDLRFKSATAVGSIEKIIRLTTNIFRSEWPVVSDPEQAISESEEGTFPVAWEEKLTVHVSQRAGRPPVFIILLDPLPKLSLTSESVTKNGATSTISDYVAPFVQAYSRAPMGPRLGLIDVFDGRPLDERAIRILGSNLTNTNCTREDLTSWLESIHGVWPENSEMDMITGLLWIIHRDVIGFLYFVSTVLEEIGLNATDDYLIQKRLTHWRNLITRFQTELPAIRVSIKTFFEFVSQYQPLDQAKGFIQHTIDQIDDLIEQNEKSYAALRADMALLESKRAIDQAESVGKITELGFIFIPISCIAALFSMQVQPLDTPAPLYSFVIAAVITISLIYAVRLTIRSTVLIEYRRELSRKIRLYTKLAPGARIPTHLLILYALRDIDFHDLLVERIFKPLGISVLAISALGVMVLPIVFLWIRNKHMDVGFKSTLTIIVILFNAAVVVPLIVKPLKERYQALRLFRDKLMNRRTRSHSKSYKQTTLDEDGQVPIASRSTSKQKKAVRHGRKPWQRRLVATADWILGKRRKRKNDAESSYLGHDTDTISTSPSDQEQETRETKPPSPEGRRPSPDGEGAKVEQKRKVVHWRNGLQQYTDDVDPLQHHVSPFGSKVDLSLQDSDLDFSDDETYEQLTPAKRLHVRDDLGQALETPEQPDKPKSVYSEDFNPSTALVLYDHAANEARGMARPGQGKLFTPSDHQSASQPYPDAGAVQSEQSHANEMAIFNAKTDTNMPAIDDDDVWGTWGTPVRRKEGRKGKQRARDASHTEDWSGFGTNNSLEAEQQKEPEMPPPPLPYTSWDDFVATEWPSVRREPSTLDTAPETPSAETSPQDIQKHTRPSISSSPHGSDLISAPENEIASNGEGTSFNVAPEIKSDNDSTHSLTKPASNNSNLILTPGESQNKDSPSPEVDYYCITHNCMSYECPYIVNDEGETLGRGSTGCNLVEAVEID